MKRFGSVIALKPEKVAEYTTLHAAVWPEVLKMIKQCHIQNYTIFLRKLGDEQTYLFSYFEYTGEHFAADMAKMDADPVCQKWESVCGPCQNPLNNRAPGEWWANMEEVFHLD